MTRPGEGVETHGISAALTAARGPGASATMRVDVALVPQVARVAPGRVLIVIDQIRASTTITTALDLGCGDLLLAGDVRTARRLARATGNLLAGERNARKPPGFDFDNSPSELSHAEIRGRGLVICTTNGTAVLRRLRAGDHVLVGCLRNARAVAAAAVSLAHAAGTARAAAAGPAHAAGTARAAAVGTAHATSHGGPADAASPGGSIQVVCAGRLGRFVLEDAVAAGVIVGRISAYLRGAGTDAELTDAAAAAVRLRASFPDLLSAMEQSNGGATLREIGRPEDITFCAEEDASQTVPVLLKGDPMRIVALAR